jgi:hypothetical protein
MWSLSKMAIKCNIPIKNGKGRLVTCSIALSHPLVVQFDDLCIEGNMVLITIAISIAQHPYEYM